VNDKLIFHGSFPKFNRSITSVSIHNEQNYVVVAGTNDFWVINLENLKMLDNTDFWNSFFDRISFQPTKDHSFFPHSIQGVLFDNSNKNNLCIILYASKYLCYLNFDTKEVHIGRENFTNKINYCSFIGKNQAEFLMICSPWERVLTTQFKEPFIPKLYGAH